MGDLFNQEFRCRNLFTFPSAAAVSSGRSALTGGGGFHPSDVAKTKEPLRSPRVVKKANSRRLPEINGDNEGRGDGMSGDLNDIRSVGCSPTSPGAAGAPARLAWR